MYCGSLSLPNGRISYTILTASGKHPVNTIARFQCNSSYDLTGCTSSTCQYIPSESDDGNWDNSPPTCERSK